MAKSNHDYARDRREAGLCGSCGNMALPLETRCQECKDKESARAKERYLAKKTEMREKYQARKDAGLCVTAGCKNKAVAGSVKCKSCLNKQQSKQPTTSADRAKVQQQKAQQYQETKDKRQQVYQARKDAGLCVTPDCPNSASDISIYCMACLEKQRARQATASAERDSVKATAAAAQRQQWQADNVCIDCGEVRFSKLRCRHCYYLYLVNVKRLSSHAAKKQIGQCASCNNDVGPTEVQCCECKKRRREIWTKRKREKVCTICGQKPARVNKTTCKTCAEAKVKAYAERKENNQCPHCGSDMPLTPGGYCARCQSINKKKYKKKAKQLRDAIIDAYGGMCKCCGETIREFLHIDHVNNDGAAHRRKLFGTNRGGGGNRFYQWLRDQGFPQEGFQLLCANCNWAKYRYGECPHQRKSAPDE